MKSKIKAIEECASLLEIDIAPETIDKAFGEVYGEIAKYANIPGFRAGKAPVELVKKHYAKNAREEVLKRLIPDAYRGAVEEHGLRPISLPEISEVNFDNEKKLSFKAKVTTRPVFKLKNYKGIKVEKSKAKVTETEVDKMLQNLRELNAKYTSVEDRPAKMGDYIVSDMDCTVDGKAAHKKRENLWLLLEKESLIPELSEKMAGMNKGEERDIDVTLPEKYPDKNLAGRLARYHIKAKEIKMRELPELNDEFAKVVGRPNMEDLKKEISRELENHAKMNAEVEAENQLLKKLIDDNSFAVPSDFTARQIGFMVEDAKRHLMEKGFKKEDLDSKDAEFKERFKSEAVRKVRLMFILDEITANEKIDVTGEDLENAYKAISAQSGKPAEEVRAHYEKEDLVDNLKDKLREGKAIQFLMRNAEITEKE